MRGGVREWVVRSTVAAVAAALVLVPMVVLLLAVHGNLWRLTPSPPSWVPGALLVAVSPLAAVPGCLTSYVAGQDRRSRRLAAAASLAGWLAGWLLTTSMLGPWAAMTVASVLAVAWRARVGRPVSVTPDPPEAGGGWTAVEVEGLEVRVTGPRSRLVPRDVLAPPEGWEVPRTLPDRAAPGSPDRGGRRADG
jgi:hypothetical protein